MGNTLKDEQRLFNEMMDPMVKDDLVNWVSFTFPWGKEGTPLAGHQGPRHWQLDELNRMTEFITHNRGLFAIGQTPLVYKSATASGRGVGKSALTSWIILWMMSTRLGSSTIVSANTEIQLKTKTWAELGRWHTLSINCDWFDKGALTLKPMPWFEKALKEDLRMDCTYYYAQGLLWSEENPDAFAGVHNPQGELVIFDEASGIPEAIWNVTSGFFTEKIVDRYWFCFSNPRRNTGAFYECFHAQRDEWQTRNLDSRDVEETDHNHLNSLIRIHGEDSDVARVEVKGQFPKQGDQQFISREVVEDAISRELVEDSGAPLIMGVDVARYGDDCTVFRWRKGRDARSIPAREFKSMDNMEVANQAAYWIQMTEPDAVCIDAGGAGAGVIDRLKQLNYQVHEVWFGAKSEAPEWGNKRTELWNEMRSWLRGGCIDGEKNLVDDLVGPMYRFRAQSDLLILEPKEEMKKRGLHSPDHGDALALTFAAKVPRKDLLASRSARRKSRVVRGVDYDIFGRR